MTVISLIYFKDTGYLCDKKDLYLNPDCTTFNWTSMVAPVITFKLYFLSFKIVIDITIT